MGDHNGGAGRKGKGVRVVAGRTAGNELEPGTPAWAEARSPQWLREGVANAKVPSDLGKLTRRVNLESDQDLDRANNWSVGAALEYIKLAKARLATERYTPPSAAATRAKNILTITNSDGRRTARRRV